MRRAATLSVSLKAPFDEVFDFVSDAQNLHLWTVDFATSPPERRGDLFVVATPRGPLELFVRGNRESGVIDFHFGRDGQFRCSPSRLVRNEDGCVYMFTQFEPPDAPPGLFEKLVENVRKELEILENRWTR
ncbi:MAG: hypothetical protein ACREJC_07130 [Tepidisphaeraceae bacterium]